MYLNNSSSLSFESYGDAEDYYNFNKKYVLKFSYDIYKHNYPTFVGNHVQSGFYFSSTDNDILASGWTLTQGGAVMITGGGVFSYETSGPYMSSNGFIALIYGSITNNDLYYTLSATFTIYFDGLRYQQLNTAYQNGQLSLKIFFKW